MQKSSETERRYCNARFKRILGAYAALRRELKARTKRGQH
jgi:hypothetical protein